MAFDDIETSRCRGMPINLYYITAGPQVFAYTDADADVLFTIGDDSEPTLFLATAIDRDALEVDGTLDRATIEINVPRDLAVVDLYRIYPPSEVIGVVIFQGHANDLEFVAIYSGRVLGCSDDEEFVAHLTCEPVSTSMRRTALRVHYQYGCPHVLYGPKCRANQATATVTAEVTSVTGTQITLPDGWEGTRPRLKYLGGLATWTTADGRTILRSILRLIPGDENTMLVSGIAVDLEPGDTISLALGCNRRSGLDDDCAALHDNIQNFGGCPWIPLKNPIGQLNNFY